MDDAAKCLKIAKEKYKNKDTTGAIRMAKKAKRLDSSLDIEPLLKEWTKEEKVPIELTPKQKSILDRLQTTGKNDYYGILQVTKDADETAIKKAYRKLALHLHPDKCADPKAKDAFLKVSKAFDILSDTQKRRHFDVSGTDPDDRSQHFNQFRRNQHARDNMDDMMAEQIFAQFFGMHPNQFRGGFHAHFQQPQRARRPPPREETGFNFPLQLLPLLIFVLFSVLPSFFSVNPPAYSLYPQRHLKPYKTPNRFDYYVREYDMKQFMRKGGSLNDFERDIDSDIIGKLRQKCRQEHRSKQEKIYAASYTWYGVRDVDEEALAKANAIVTPSCDELTMRHISK